MPSKRTISDEAVETFVLHLLSGDPAKDYTEAGEQLIAHFSDEGHDPFTRKDWDIVLEAYAANTGNIEIPGVVKVANKTFEKLTKGLTRPKWGYYSSMSDEERAQDASVALAEHVDEAQATKAHHEAAVDAVEAEQAEVDNLLDAVLGDPNGGPSLDDLLDAAAAQAPEPEPAPEPAPEPVETQGGVSWLPPTPKVPNAALYVEDAGLRRLAVSQTSCFGNYSDRAPTCDGCPLAGFCATASMTSFADITAALDHKTEQAISRARRSSVTEEAEAMAYSTGATVDSVADDLLSKADAVTQEPAEDPLPEGASLIQPPWEATCSACNKIVPALSTAVHLPGKGLVHKTCVGK